VLDRRKNEAMDVDVLFAGIAVSDLNTALAWYERFFDRRADIVAHETEVMWQITERGWLYVLRDVGRAGSSIVTLAVPDVDAAASAIASRDIEVGPIAPEGDAGMKAIALDPDGNTVAIIEVRHQ
jgi:predicted enzyme related to lactoylglutathione lyase